MKRLTAIGLCVAAAIGLCVVAAIAFVAGISALAVRVVETDEPRPAPASPSKRDDVVEFEMPSGALCVAIIPHRVDAGRAIACDFSRAAINRSSDANGDGQFSGQNPPTPRISRGDRKEPAHGN